MNNDLISRSELRKAVNDFYDNHFKGLVPNELITYAEAVDNFIDNAPTVVPERPQCNQIAWEQGYEVGYAQGKSERPQGEWIPVSKRLPDDMQKVLIWFEYYRYGDFNCMYQTYGFGYVCDGKWSPFINGETGWQDYNIIAWQPLPEPCGRNHP